MAKYSIIGSFFDIRKTKFYKIFNPKKYKYAMKDEKYTYKNGPIRGHRALALSLFRGFQKLEIEYDYNEIKSDCENVILLWTDKKELKIVEKLKKTRKN